MPAAGGISVDVHKCQVEIVQAEMMDDMKFVSEAILDIASENLTSQRAEPLEPFGGSQA